MIPTWETEEKDKKSQKMGKNGSKWLKIVQFYPLRAPKPHFMNFPEDTGTKTH